MTVLVLTSDSAFMPCLISVIGRAHLSSFSLVTAIPPISPITSPRLLRPPLSLVAYRPCNKSHNAGTSHKGNGCVPRFISSLVPTTIFTACAPLPASNPPRRRPLCRPLPLLPQNRNVDDGHLSSSLPRGSQGHPPQLARHLRLHWIRT